MIRPYWIGLALAACGPLAFGFLSSDLSYAVVFPVLFFVAHRLIRPFDWPRGWEIIQNTGASLLLGRAVFHGVQAGVLLILGGGFAGGLAYPFRSVFIPGQQVPVVPFLMTPEPLAAICVALTLAGLALAVATKSEADVFTTRAGPLGWPEAFDRLMTARLSRTSAMFSPQASSAGEGASMVVIRPWALWPLSSRQSPEALAALVDKVAPGGPERRLAAVLDVASARGNPHAATALRELRRLRGPGAAALSPEPGSTG